MSCTDEVFGRCKAAAAGHTLLLCIDGLIAARTLAGRSADDALPAFAGRLGLAHPPAVIELIVGCGAEFGDDTALPAMRLPALDVSAPHRTPVTAMQQAQKVQATLDFP